MNTNRIFINTLSVNDTFRFEDSDAVCTVLGVRSGGGRTTVEYKVNGFRASYTRPGLATVLSA